MPSDNLLTSRERIEKRARQLGWSVSGTSNSLSLRKGGVLVAVRFAARGDIMAATWQHKAITGRDKLGQVLKSLES